MGLKKLEEEFNQTSGERVLLRVLVWYWYCTSDKRKMITTAKIAPEHTKLVSHNYSDTYAYFLVSRSTSFEQSVSRWWFGFGEHQVEWWCGWVGGVRFTWQDLYEVNRNWNDRSTTSASNHFDHLRDCYAKYDSSADDGVLKNNRFRLDLWV